MHECLGRVIARMILADIIKVLEDGDLETVGREDYGTLADRLTAHPKIDPVTGEMFAFYWKQVELPYLTYQMFSKEGVLLEPVPITIPERVFIHDFAITENYAIFLDLSLMMNGKVCNIYQHEH
jgi:carotenoid cleavage dioxygenase-like enzyme